jgi:membrane fusion protein, multidrug efflux system
MMRLSAKDLALATIAVGLAATGVVLLDAGHGAERAPAAVAMPPMPVPVAPVVAQTVPVYLDFVGATQAVRTVTLQAKITGYLQAQPVPDGADVQQGELLYQIDPHDYQAALNQVEAQAARDAAALEYAQASQHRNEELVKDGWATKDAFDQSTSTYHQAKALIAADAAAIQTAMLNMHYTEIRAPFAGRLGQSQVHEGALINAAGTQLNTLVQLDPIYVAFNPSETDLPLIDGHRTGKSIPAEVTLPGSGGSRYEGTVTFLNNSVDQNTGTIAARATIANPQHTLLPGEFVHIRLHAGDRPGALLVPQIAVGSSQFGSYVYVADQGKAIRKPVTLGTTYGDLVVVTDGISAGEAVVVGNLQKVMPGASIQPIAGQRQDASKTSG